jgi:hypothetical protein
MTQLEALADVPAEQHSLHSLAGDRTPAGDLILYEEWEGDYPLKYEVCCYDSLGALKWHQYPPRLTPSWLVAARDRPTVVVVSNSSWLATLDTRTGAVLDTHHLYGDDATALSAREFAIGQGLLTLSARGNIHPSTPILISAGVGEDGKISDPIVTTDWMWGLSQDHPICGTAVPDSAGGWLITGFRRE